ncbi:MAG: IS4 family transposase, partial [bacterium]
FHRVLKTGCRVERIQLKTAQAVIHAIMIYSVIAWRILYLTHLGRQCPDLPCGCVFEEAEWKSACAVVKRKPEAGEPSLSEFIRIVGKLGGHLGRKNDGAPGPQSIWQGLTRVRDFACAWHAFYGE